MKTPFRILLIASCLAVSVPASAHRAWMLPSATVLSDTDTWVTVDAAVSNDLFYFEHFPLRLAGIGGDPEGVPDRGRRGGPGAALTILAPDGSKASPINGSTGRYRTTFDIHLQMPGTYKLAVVSDGLSASYKENGKRKRWRGPAEKLKDEVPAGAEDLKVTTQQRRMEVFITAGKPTKEVLKPTGKGLELEPVTHPNDLYAKEPATFRFLLDGKPAAGIKLLVIPGGSRYRDKLNEMQSTTDADGKVTFTWPAPGMYWLEAETEDDRSPVKGAKRRSTYVATLEVLPQ
jgi:uncharacterized GH25 family protein